MRVTDLKNIIKFRVPNEYKVSTNFSSPDSFIFIGDLLIIAKTICTETEVKYEFMLDTQFISSKEISYNELIIAKEVIELLEENRKVATSRLKKWKVEDYLRDKELKEKQSIAMMEALMKCMQNMV